MSEPANFSIDEKLLDSVIGLAIRMLEYASKIGDQERQEGQDVDQVTELAMAHLALRTAADFLERGIFPAGLEPRIQAIIEAATHRLTREFRAARKTVG